MLDKTFKKPATINSWVIVDFTHRSNSTKLTQFLQKLYHAMQTLGSLWVYLCNNQFIFFAGMGNFLHSIMWLTSEPRLLEVKPPKQRAGVGYAVEQVRRCPWMYFFLLISSSPGSRTSMFRLSARPPCCDSQRVRCGPLYQSQAFRGYYVRSTDSVYREFPCLKTAFPSTQRFIEMDEEAFGIEP
jgi:hypothetical protein